MNRGKMIQTCGLFLFLIVVSLFALACSPQNPPENPYQPKIDELWEQYDNDPDMLGYVMIAAHLDITVEEAKRREGIQASLEGLGSRLEADEPETFGGLWIQQQEPFCIVVAFTENGEETIKRYVTTEELQHISVRTVQYSYAELRRAQDAAGQALRDIGIIFMSATDIMNNSVWVRVPDRTPIDEAVAAGTLTIPDFVEIKVGPLATLE